MIKKERERVTWRECVKGNTKTKEGERRRRRMTNDYLIPSSFLSLSTLFLSLFSSSSSCL